MLIITYFSPLNSFLRSKDSLVIRLTHFCLLLSSSLLLFCFQNQAPFHSVQYHPLCLPSSIFFSRFFYWDFTFSFPVALNICFYGVPMETGYLNVSVFKRHLADAHMWMSTDAHKHHTCTFCSYLHANHQYNSEHCPG